MKSNLPVLLRRIRAVICVAGVLAVLPALPARAAFHLWDINEIYSNADGSVQFVELFTSFGSQQFVSGHQVICSSATATNTFIFPSNSPSPTGNRFLLLATTNFAAHPGGLSPDFVIPPGFVLPGSATLNFVDADVVNYSNLPSNGVASVVRSGSVMVSNAVNSPSTFAGQSNSIVPVRFSGVAASGGGILLSFPTATGPNGSAGPGYTVQFKDDVAAAVWQNLVTLPGNGATLTATNPAALAPQRVFRLSVQ